MRANANDRTHEGEIWRTLTQGADPLGRMARFRERTGELITLTEYTSQSDSVRPLPEDAEMHLRALLEHHQQALE